MIGRGKHNEVFLYEVTEQDLLVDDGTLPAYHVGNVLMFSDKRSATPGNELARADDLSAAFEYLDQIAQYDEPAEPAGTQTSPAGSQTNLRDEGLRELTEKIEQRDELLRDLSETLKSQKQDNELLHAQLKNTQAQLAVDELKCNELVDDLQHVSEETYTIESTLERVMDEKFQLEQELAERITELVELNLQNDDLRRQLIAPETTTARPSPGRSTATEAGRMADHDALGVADPQILTMASGKQIHIFHEFPTAPKPTLLARAGHVLVSGMRVVGIILFAALVLGAASIITTAQVNHISFGDALDLLLKSLGLS